MSHSRIYSIWKGLRRRCNNPRAPKYEYYGGMGIRVCEEWNHPNGGFKNFYSWAMQNGYNDNLTIDRKDSLKDYSPDNCQWITMEENREKALHTANVPKYQYFGYNKKENLIVVFYKIRKFSEKYGISSRRVSDVLTHKRENYDGWIFKRIPIKEANIIEGQETIPFGSTSEDELPTEVQIVRLDLDNREYCMRFLHVSDKDIVQNP